MPISYKSISDFEFRIPIFERMFIIYVSVAFDFILQFPDELATADGTIDK